jgi:hypothetical protein
MADGSPRRLGVDAGVPSGRQGGTRRYPLPGALGLVLREGADGSVDVQFGGRDSEIPNCLPIEAGWNYMVRLYQPRPEVLNGTWKFPEAQPAS